MNEDKLTGTKEAVWVPPQIKKEIREIVYKENWKAEWRLIEMLLKNYKIFKNTTNDKKK